MIRTTRTTIGFAVAITAFAVAPLLASAQSFRDVPQNHAAFQAIEYLKAKGVLQGYQDGTFKPGQSVNRAEAVKIIVAQMVPADQIAALQGVSVYSDVDGAAWFAPFIEKARKDLGIVDGPPKTTTFAATRPVKEVEFLKMLLLANKIDPSTSYSEIQRPLAQDVTNPGEWYYPYLRYAFTASMVTITPDGRLDPGKELTRGDIALLLHRFLMYREGRRTQALLSLTETEILNTLQALEAKDLDQAGYAASRSMLAARGALTSLPDDNLVKAALKTSEGFLALVSAYRAGAEGKLDDAIKFAGDAWNLAQQARDFSPGLDNVTTQMQTIAAAMANEARKLKGVQ